MKGFIVILCLYLIKLVYAAEQVYEFGGEADGAQVIYSKSGLIPAFHYETDLDIPVPVDMEISYIKVKVRSLSPPKVDYDHVYKKVSIKYTWIQVTISSYELMVKAVPIISKEIKI